MLTLCPDVCLRRFDQIEQSCLCCFGQHATFAWSLGNLKRDLLASPLWPRVDALAAGVRVYDCVLFVEQLRRRSVVLDMGWGCL